MLPCSRVPLAKKSGPQAGLANINRSLRGVVANHEELLMKLTVSLTVYPSHYELTGLYLLDQIRSVIDNVKLNDVVQYTYIQLGREIEVDETTARESGKFQTKRKFYCQITLPNERIPELLELEKVEQTECGLKPIMKIPDDWLLHIIEKNDWAEEIILNSDDIDRTTPDDDDEL